MIRYADGLLPLDIDLVSFTEAIDLVTGKLHPYDQIVSIRDPGAMHLMGEGQILTQRYWDIREGPDAPERHHVETLVELGMRLQPAKDAAKPRILVHCEMGISRSSAAAIILQCAAMNVAGNPPHPRLLAHAFNALIKLQHDNHQVRPNIRMLKMAEKIFRAYNVFNKLYRRVYVGRWY